MPKQRNRWREYERRKAAIQRRRLSPEQYEAAIKALLRKLRL